MIMSMTGYASASAELDICSLTLELRAVNYRYLDVQMRMAAELRSFESFLREAITSKLQRGKVECRINYVARSEQLPATLNHALLKQLAALNNAVQSALPDSASLTVADVLHWNGMLDTPDPSNDKLRISLLELLDIALHDFSASRAREGNKIKEFLLLRIEKLEKLIEDVIPRVPMAIAAYTQKITTRLQDAMLDNDHERIRQEIALFTSKIDVDEELSRLNSHITEMRRILSVGGTVGKRLDFLMQELNREANTLGSKSVDVEVSRCAMELKVLIEQMREQIQNLE